MQSMNNLSKQGFTLIELLVVFLIIGILAWVALPQYQKTVEKARATEAITVISKLENAMEVYKLANGLLAEGEMVQFLGEEDSIPLDIKLSCKKEEYPFCFTKNFRYRAFCLATGCYIQAHRRSNAKIRYVLESTMEEKDTWGHEIFAEYTDDNLNFGQDFVRSLQWGNFGGFWTMDEF